MEEVGKMESKIIRERLELLFKVGLLSRLAVSEDCSKIEATVRLPERFDFKAFKKLVETLAGKKYRCVNIVYNSGSLEIVIEGVMKNDS